MNRIYIPSSGPQAWQGLLAEPEKQWRTGYSARTLAHCWEAAEGALPPEVSALFEASLGRPELLLAIPEHKVPLPGGRKESQNDVFALLRVGAQTISVTVEGKVNEPFGPTIGEWFANPSTGKQERLAFLRTTLGLSEPVSDEIHYQLLHRTASAVIEAERFGTNAAAMIVHSFSTENRWFEAFRDFAHLFGIEPGVDELVTVNTKSRTPLYLGWAAGDRRFSSA